MMIEIELPFPEDLLKTNKGTHWRGKQEPKANARFEGKCLSLKYFGIFTKEQELCMDISFLFKDKRRRDIDNLLSSMKHHIDGVFLGLGVDDSQVCDMHLQRFYKKEKNTIIMRISEL